MAEKSENRSIKPGSKLKVEAYSLNNFLAVSWLDSSDFDSREIIDYLPKSRIYIKSMKILKFF